MVTAQNVFWGKQMRFTTYFIEISVDIDFVIINKFWHPEFTTEKQDTVDYLMIVDSENRLPLASASSVTHGYQSMTLGTSTAKKENFNTFKINVSNMFTVGSRAKK